MAATNDDDDVKIYDVIVVGAGISGLSAALKLSEKVWNVHHHCDGLSFA